MAAFSRRRINSRMLCGLNYSNEKRPKQHLTHKGDIPLIKTRSGEDESPEMCNKKGIKKHEKLPQ